MKHVLYVALLSSPFLAACGGDPAPASKKKLDDDPDTIERRYGKPTDKVWDATVSAVKSLDLRLDSDRNDELGGELVARRADGHRVMANVSTVEKNVSKVLIRVEPGNRHLAGLVHERIAEKLGMGEAKAALLGGNTVDGGYALDFPGAIAAAERSCKALGFTVTHKEIHDTWAQLDARSRDSTPVRFRMERQKDRVAPTKVTFIAGRGKTDDSKSMIGAMKAEFERQLAPPPPAK